MRFAPTALLLLFLLLPWAMKAQSQELANAYFRKGEYQKAIMLFEPLYQANPVRQDYFKALLTCYQQLEEFDKAEHLLNSQLQAFPNQLYLLVEIGYNQQLMGNQTEADRYYQLALEQVRNNPNYTFIIGRSFRQNHLLNHALEAYSTGKKANPNLQTEISEAQIYGELGEIETMFSLYLDLLEKNENYYPTVQRFTGSFISDDPQDANNQAFRKLLLKRAQSDPRDSWNILLSWLFMQQGDYKKSLTQEISLFKRNPQSLERIEETGHVAFDNNDLETSRKAYEFIVDNSSPGTTDLESLLRAHIYLLKIDVETKTSKSDREKTLKDFQALIEQFGIRQSTLVLQLAYAEFLTFQMNDPEEAIAHLDKTLESARFSPREKGIVEMTKADILVFSDQFNQALILYSKIQYDLKNSPLAQEARFKVARTSYFKGDFQWAQNQLKVLKSSTSQLIANDALDLSLKIGNNMEKDSLNQGLALFAKAEQLAFQQKTQQAIDTLDVVLKDFKGQAIEDDALLTQALLLSGSGRPLKAEENLQMIMAHHPQSLLIDQAVYELGLIYEKQLNNSEKAKEMYQKIIFEHPSSIYLVEARKAFRRLRGDAL